MDGTSTMVLSEDLGVLLLGAREAIYALSLKNISVKESAVRRRRMFEECADDDPPQNPRRE